MKLRYYLRGLGTGILVAALILGRLISESRPLTDAEIRAKALTLGMVDANSLSLSDMGGNGNAGSNTPQDLAAGGSGTSSPEPVGTFEPDVSEPPGTDPDAADSPEITESPDPVTESVTSPSPEATPETTTSAPDSGETVTIEIFRGDGSYAVSVRLAEAGLVADAREFDSYLVNNGYSRSIRAGTYKIPVGASWEEIADIIS